MKKFLSLVLALVMTMSLVTVSAGATEYKDLTDKSEIKYAEAVAVMNKIGIISGYEDGSFKPTGTLTRGAAAKIITYMMLGSTAGEQLGVVVKPYKDVAMDNTFAPYIAYCKSTGLINGYSDGTFRPAAPLDGYSFSKMLLTALGYKSENEGFIGSGWQTNVARMAVKSSLYAGNDAFVGSATVTREEACLYAFNTLKATEVEYAGSDITVTGKDTTVTVGNTKAEWVKNDKTVSSGQTYNNYSDGLTQFCEEHFPALKLVDDGTATDGFGRPSNKWAFKKTTIGTYPQTADFTFTAKMSSSSIESTVLKDLGLKGYKLSENGVTAVINGKPGATLASVANINDLTGNGTKVEVFISDDAANTITDVVAIRTQLMQVNTINTASKTVTLKQISDMKDSADIADVAVTTVKEDDANYAALSTLKVDDYVLVTPVWVSGTKYDVSSVATPTVVTGKMTRLALSNATVKGMTVAGTEYKVSTYTHKDIKGLTDTAVVSAKKDVTLYLDSFGYAMYIKDVVSTSDFMVVKGIYTTIVDGKIVYMVQGWDLTGGAIELNVGTASPDTSKIKAGAVASYTSVGATGSADYVVNTDAYSSGTAGQLTAYNYGNVGGGGTARDLKAGDTKVYKVGDNPATPSDGTLVGSDMKVIFVNGLTLTNVDSITVKKGMQNVGAATVGNNATLVIDKDGIAKAIVIRKEADDMEGRSVLFVTKKSAAGVDNGKTLWEYTAYVDGVETEKILSKNNIAAKSFASYSKDETTGYYTLSGYDYQSRTTSVMQANVISTGVNSGNDGFVNLTGAKNFAGVALATTGIIDASGNVTNLKTANAKWVDLTNRGITKAKDLLLPGNAGVSLTLYVVYGENTSNNSFNSASYIFVDGADLSDLPTNYTITAASGLKYCTTNSATLGDWKSILTAPAGSTVYVKTDANQKTISGTLTNLTTVQAPTESLPGIYSFKLDKNYTALEITLVDLFKVAVTAENVYVNNIDFIVSTTPNSVQYLKTGEVVKVTVAIRGTNDIGTNTVTLTAPVGANFTNIKRVTGADGTGFPVVTGLTTAPTAGSNTMAWVLAGSGNMDVAFTADLTVAAANITLAIA